MPTGYQWFRFGCLALLWLALCWLLVSSQPFTPRVAFIVVSSGIVVFVPLYRKYVKKARHDDNNGGDGR